MTGNVSIPNPLENAGAFNQDGGLLTAHLIWAVGFVFGVLILGIAYCYAVEIKCKSRIKIEAMRLKNAYNTRMEEINQQSLFKKEDTEE